MIGGFPGVSDGNAGDQRSSSGSGRCPGEGNGNPLPYSCLENSMDQGAWRATVHELTESDMIEQLMDKLFNFNVPQFPHL